MAFHMVCPKIWNFGKLHWNTMRLRVQKNFGNIAQNNSVRPRVVDSPRPVGTGKKTTHQSAGWLGNKRANKTKTWLIYYDNEYLNIYAILYTLLKKEHVSKQTVKHIRNSYN